MVGILTVGLIIMIIIIITDQWLFVFIFFDQ